MPDVKALIVAPDDTAAGGGVHREVRADERLVDADGNTLSGNLAGLGNRNMPALSAVVDGDLATLAGLADNPSAETGQAIRVFVNGLLVSVGDGDKLAACYFSDDDGATAKALDSLETGDKLFWVRTVAGYPLLTSFLIDFVFDI